jgi:uncharacterized protein (TIGR02466 family)
MVEQNKDIKFFFPTVIQETMVENHEELNRSLVAAISRLRQTTPGTVPGAWACELYTTLVTNSLLHRTPEFAPLVRHIQEQAERFARFLHFDLERYRLSIVNCWVNVYGPHHAQDVHVHTNCVLSGVYYVQVPKGTPGLLIRSPVEDTMIHAPLSQPSFANALTHEIQAVEGKMVFFRSFVRHSVRPNPVEGERISIAFNLTA